MCIRTAHPLIPNFWGFPYMWVSPLKMVISQYTLEWINTLEWTAKTIFCGQLTHLHPPLTQIHDGPPKTLSPSPKKESTYITICWTYDMCTSNNNSGSFANYHTTSPARTTLHSNHRTVHNLGKTWKIKKQFWLFIISISYVIANILFKDS